MRRLTNTNSSHPKPGAYNSEPLPNHSPMEPWCHRTPLPASLRVESAASINVDITSDGFCALCPP